MIVLASLLAAMALVASPVGAKTRHRGAPCGKIKEALASGKTAGEVAKEFKVSESAVKHCEAQPTKTAKTTKK